MPLRHHPLPGTDLSISTFCYGLGDIFSDRKINADEILDAYVEAGGNFFDSAHVYSMWIPGGTGASEIGIGDYARRRGLKDIVIATKGGHPGAPGYRKVDHYLSPARLGADIEDSLGRLQRDTIDLYYLHRDDPRVPVDEIIDALNAQITHGRIRYIGASNWPVERIAAANAYAQGKNLRPFIISQPRWSLATDNHPGALDDNKCLSYAEKEIAWHLETSLPVAPYSPAAAGFFGETSPGTEKNFGTPENLQRRERAVALAKKLGVTAAQINLAWLINHPFPVFPIIGNKNKTRLAESLAADSIQLSESDLAHLDLKSS